MPEFSPSKAPFRSPLEISDFSDRGSHTLYEFKDDPSRVVRFHVLRNQENKEFSSVGELKEEDIERINSNLQLLKELPEKYGIDVVPFEAVIGENQEHQPGVYMIAKKLTGRNLESLLSQPSTQSGLTSEGLDAFFLKLLTYLDDKHQSGEVHLRDIFDGGQYIVEEGTKNITLIDVDPLVARSDDIAPQKRTRFIVKNLGVMWHMLKQASPHSLPNSSHRLRAIASTLDSRDDRERAVLSQIGPEEV